MKRIIVCADGTWNERDQTDSRTGKRRPTNVTKVARAVRPRAADGTHQVVVYLEGVGTDGGLDKLTGGGFGSGIEDNIRTLYRAIVYNYEPGDELYFFGFSRGAFTVRTLAGFMNYVGLLEKDDDYFLPEIYACYEKGVTRGSAEWNHAFRKANGTRTSPAIRFLGVWDTVGALGAPGLLGHVFNGKKYAYHDVALHDGIQNAFHALGIDERRKPFAPSVWKRPAGWNGTLVQAWFAGVHSDVGGGLTPDGLANVALHWLVGEAEKLGLEVNHDYLRPYLACYNGTKHESMSLMYHALGAIDRDVCASDADGEVLHRSVLDRFNDTACNYRPQKLAEYIARHGGSPPTVGAPLAPCPPI